MKPAIITIGLTKLRLVRNNSNQFSVNYLIGIVTGLFLLNTSVFGQTNMSLYPNVGIVSNSPVLRGRDLTLMATGGNSYQWAGPNSFSSTSKNVTIPSISQNAAGNYYCTVYDALTNTSTALTLKVDVLVRQATNIISDPYVCEHSNFEMSTNTQGITYHWEDLTSGWDAYGQYTVENNIQGLGVHSIKCTITTTNGPLSEYTTVVVRNCCTTGPANLLYNTSFSSQSINNNYPVVILGTVHADINYISPSNADIILLNNALLEVDPGKKFTTSSGTTIHGCDTMWYGINLHDQDQLTMHQTTMTEGYNGILMDNIKDPQITMERCTLFKNGNAMTIMNMPYFYNNLVLNEFHSTNAPLIIPLAGLPQFSGIFSSNSVLDFQNPEESTNNIFHDMENGIFTMGSMSITVPKYFARFYNFNTQYTTAENPGHGIYI